MYSRSATGPDRCRMARSGLAAPSGPAPACVAPSVARQPVDYRARYRPSIRPAPCPSSRALRPPGAQFGYRDDPVRLILPSRSGERFAGVLGAVWRDRKRDVRLARGRQRFVPPGDDGRLRGHVGPASGDACRAAGIEPVAGRRILRRGIVPRSWLVDVLGTGAALEPASGVRVPGHDLYVGGAAVAEPAGHDLDGAALGRRGRRLRLAAARLGPGREPCRLARAGAGDLRHLPDRPSDRRIVLLADGRHRLSAELWLLRSGCSGASPGSRIRALATRPPRCCWRWAVQKWACSWRSA